MTLIDIRWLARAAAVLLLATPAYSQDVALLFFDGERGAEFAGCLNCSRYDDVAVCNKYGDFGSKYSDVSIWNKYGRYGSKYEENSPWSKYGSGLRIVDVQGNFYGHFTSSSFGRSSLPVVASLVEANEAMGDLSALRDLFC